MVLQQDGSELAQATANGARRKIAVWHGGDAETLRPACVASRWKSAWRGNIGAALQVFASDDLR